MPGTKPVKKKKHAVKATSSTLEVPNLETALYLTLFFTKRAPVEARILHIPHAHRATFRETFAALQRLEAGGYIARVADSSDPEETTWQMTGSAAEGKPPVTPAASTPAGAPENALERARWREQQGIDSASDTMYQSMSALSTHVMQSRGMTKLLEAFVQWQAAPRNGSVLTESEADGLNLLLNAHQDTLENLKKELTLAWKGARPLVLSAETRAGGSEREPRR